MNKFVAALCVSAALLSTTMAQSAEVALPPFYQKIGQMKPKGPLGTVIAKEKIATKIPGADAWRIAYISSDLKERPTISTGLVIAPKGKPPQDGRPILAWAHGTTGTAQNCGPSQVLDPAQDLNEYFLIGGTSWTDFGVPAATDFIKLGYVLVATDYQGLGGGGSKHQYTIAATQARDHINSVRAVGNMGLSGRNKKAVLYGWSQGAGSVIAAVGMPDYINQKNTAFDGVEIIGGVALAPQDIAALIPPAARTEDDAAAKMMQQLSTQFSGNVFDFTHLAMSLWAMVGTFPNLKMSDLYTSQGETILNEVLTKKCMHSAADTLSFNLGSDFKSMMLAQPLNSRAWVNALVESSVSAAKPIAPVMIYYGSKDTTVPPVMGALYQKAKCAMGGNIGRVELPGQSHFTTPPTSQAMYSQWIKDRFQGKPAPDGCKS
jgi:pimeloyl-ACP methyl ester carboxylesterase